MLFSVIKTVICESIIYEMSDKLYGDYKNFLKLLHPDVKICPRIEDKLRDDGLIRTSFMIACKSEGKVE